MPYIQRQSVNNVSMRVNSFIPKKSNYFRLSVHQTLLLNKNHINCSVKLPLAEVSKNA